MLCEHAARAGGQAIASWVGRFGVHKKGPADLVTEADWASQEAIRKAVLLACPGHHFVAEESDAEPRFDAEYCWVVDPLDGTTNFVHQVPHYAVSVALAHHGQVIVGVVFDPLADECFAAERGKGARLNGKPIHASRVSELAEALVAASFASSVNFPSPEVNQFVATLLACQAVRRTGSAALNLCYVASGRFDAFWSLSTKAWDVAAGMLLVEEAGGVVTSAAGGAVNLYVPHPVACATAELHRQFLGLLRTASPVNY
jgi:myo-inositol-1(or 4)-monophosphatase